MAAHPALISLAEYLGLEARATVRHEYIDGLVYAMSGASRNHVEIIARLHFLLATALEGSDCRLLGQDTKVWVQEARSLFYPDATVACPPNFVNDSSGVIDNPRVIFEILSPSTALLDEGPKFAAYLKLASLQNYVVIDSRHKHLKVFSLEEGAWVVREFGKDATEVAIPSLGLRVETAEIYRFAVFED
jgi:Uma2 family endonuclease